MVPVSFDVFGVPLDWVVDGQDEINHGWVFGRLVFQGGALGKDPGSVGEGHSSWWKGGGEQFTEPSLHGGGLWGWGRAVVVLLGRAVPSVGFSGPSGGFLCAGRAGLGWVNGCPCSWCTFGDLKGPKVVHVSSNLKSHSNLKSQKY